MILLYYKSLYILRIEYLIHDIISLISSPGLILLSVMHRLVSLLFSFLAFLMLLPGIACKRLPSDSIRDARDGNLYTYILRDDLNWMTCNLNYLDEAIYCNGAWVFSYDKNEYTDALIKIDRSKSGVLYNWEVAMKVSPEEWRIPSLKEWQKLLSRFEENKEKSAGEYNIILDGRARIYDKFCIYSGSTFWTSDQTEDGESAMVVVLNFNDNGSLDIRYEEQKKEHAFYVRCVKAKHAE